MTFQNLRDFLAVLEENGQLIRVKTPISPEPDVASAARAALRFGANRAPAVLLENIKGYKNSILLNIHGSWANHALMLNLPRDTSIKEQFHELNRRWPGKTVKPIWVEDAPCKEVIVDKNINLFEILPLYRSNKYDGGCYISKASTISRDLDDPKHFGKQNLGIYRIQVTGKDRVNIQPLAFHDLGLHFRKAEERNEPLPVAITIGNDPVVTLMGCTPLEYEQSEYEYVGALKQKPCELIKAETADLDLPAGTEIVLEGELIPRKRSVEGPFGEFTGSYSGARLHPEVKINMITHRKNPIFENLCLGIPWTEIDYLLALNTSIPVYRQIKATFPEVEAVNAMYIHGIVTIISTKCRFGGYGKSVAMRLLSTPHGMPYSKFVIVVDDFVDPFDLNQVMWALATRVNPEKHVSLINNCPGMPLDPSSSPRGMHTKVIIDATTPVLPEVAGFDTILMEEPEKTDYWEQILRTLAKEMETRK